MSVGHVSAGAKAAFTWDETHVRAMLNLCMFTISTDEYLERL
jgi:hypothetical protein